MSPPTQQTDHPWRFVPTMGLFQALTFAFVSIMPGIFLKSIGAPNSMVGLASLFYLPVALRFLVGSIVDRNGSKRLWALWTQIAQVLVAAVSGTLILAGAPVSWVLDGRTKPGPCSTPLPQIPANLEQLASDPLTPQRALHASPRNRPRRVLAPTQPPRGTGQSLMPHTPVVTILSPPRKKPEKSGPRNLLKALVDKWVRGRDLNPRPSGYEPDEWQEFTLTLATLLPRLLPRFTV